MTSISLPGPIVSGRWLTEHLDEVDVADVRWSVAEGPKRSDYLNGHVPGAVFVDLDADLSDPPGTRGRHPLPSVQRFRATLARLGLGRRPKICYDDSSGATAARLWWMAQAIGLPAAVLDGGIEAWAGPLASGETLHDGHGATGALDVDDASGETWPSDLVVAVDAVLDRIDEGAVLLDARSAERFAGEPNPVDPVAGHIPGAHSRPWTDNIGPDGRFLPPDRLAGELSGLGVSATPGWMASCGSGVTGCHNLLAAKVAGLPDGRLYPGSWSEWIQDTSRPVETDLG